MRKILIATVGLLLMGAGCTATDKTENSGIQTETRSAASANEYVVKTKDREIIVSEKKWKKMEDPAAFGKNFEAREKGDTEEFPQVISVFLNPMISDDKVGARISDDEFVEMFSVFPKTVTVQTRVDKGTYWVLSRQTFSITDPKLSSLNPEASDNNFRLFLSHFQTEIDTTRYVLGSEF